MVFLTSISDSLLSVRRNTTDILMLIFVSWNCTEINVMEGKEIFELHSVEVADWWGISRDSAELWAPNLPCLSSR